ncbi:MAG: aldose 1-epimerase [Acidimicrobiia bacterium]
MIELTTETATVIVDPAAGGRVASIVIGGREVLVTGSPSDDPMSWGAFPMVPWAGRVRHGCFSFEDRVYELPINLAPHAIHGTGFTRAWAVEDDGSLSLTLDEDWPFGGTARQHFELHADHLVCVLEVEAGDQPMPAQVGWHPWFLKPDQLRFEAEHVYVRDDEGVPTGALVPPDDGPWDDCFTGVRQPVELHYPGLSLLVSSSCDHWVLYDQPEHATCVEPQSGPPDGFTLCPEVVSPGEPLRHTMTIAWHTP